MDRFRTGNRRTLLVLVLLLFTLIRLSSAQVFIDSAIEEVEKGSGSCLAIDPECSIDAKGHVQLGEQPSTALNLSAHLLAGDCVFCAIDLVRPARPQLHAARRDRTPIWHFAESIFHPPRA